MLTTTEAEKLQNDIARMILSVLNENHLFERLSWCHKCIFLCSSTDSVFCLEENTVKY